MERCGAINGANAAPLRSDAGGISENTALAWSLQIIASVAMSHTNAAWPSEARMVEAFGRADAKIASFRDTAGWFDPKRIVPVFPGTSAYSAKGATGFA